MPTTVRQRLVANDESPAPAVRGLEVLVERGGGDGLRFCFELWGDPSELRVPRPSTPRFADGLWRRTCFEAFVARESEVASAQAADRGHGSFRYLELNFSPSSEWAAYAFASYREPAEALRAALEPRIVVERAADRLRLTAEIRIDHLSPDLVAAPLRLGLSAVIEDTAGNLSYWALRHPPGKPDFHHRDGFALRLEPPLGE